MASSNSEEVATDAAQPDNIEKISKDVESEAGDDSGKGNTVKQMDIQSAPTFVGLGKEDLLVLANRPFWVRLRWALFITFWFLWLGLLVGAALIIALSPGCDDEMKELRYASTFHYSSLFASLQSDICHYVVVRTC